VATGNTKRWFDEWGTGWLSEGLEWKSDIHPLEGGYHLLDGFEFPDPHLPGRFDEDDLKLAALGERYAQSIVWFTVFERLWLLRGFSNTLMDPCLEPRNFCRLRDRIVEIELAMVDQWLARKVDGIFFSDDWGTQTGLLIDPEEWRRCYKPAYRALFGRVRDGGAHVWFHSCGAIRDIVPDLFELGLNVLNPVQKQALDIQRLSREFGGKLCFYGGVDVQGTLSFGTPEDVRREVHELVGLFGSFGGGYIGSTSQSIMPETPLDNIIALYEAFAEYR
jgi:uroporphyrinogen-III decarboxylase